ncbi:protein adenylyltransferase SelO family protein, partial [Wenyingzhuangia sp. 1_MG-2023]|nr:protein adenylyltransferase SelO family protein [Wenyingzhuangia sp. 1_MG-2023]
VYNHTDQEGRYAFDQQPGIIQWNLSALGQALTPLVPIDDLKDALEQFTGYYETAYRQRMSARLGLATPQPGDDELIQRWRNLLAQHQADYN